MFGFLLDWVILNIVDNVVDFRFVHSQRAEINISVWHCTVDRGAEYLLLASRVLSIVHLLDYLCVLDVR